MANSFKVITDLCRRGDFYERLLDYYCDAVSEEEREYYGELCATLQCITRQYGVPEDVSEAAQRRFEQFDRQASEERWSEFIQQVEAATRIGTAADLMLQNEMLMRELISGFRRVFELDSV